MTENNADSILMMEEMPEISGVTVVCVSPLSGVWTSPDDWCYIAKAKLVIVATDNDHASQSRRADFDFGKIGKPLLYFFLCQL